MILPWTFFYLWSFDLFSSKMSEMMLTNINGVCVCTGYMGTDFPLRTEIMLLFLYKTTGTRISQWSKVKETVLLTGWGKEQIITRQMKYRFKVTGVNLKVTSVDWLSMFSTSVVTPILRLKVRPVLIRVYSSLINRRRKDMRTRGGRVSIYNYICHYVNYMRDISLGFISVKVVILDTKIFQNVIVLPYNQVTNLTPLRIV